MVTERKCRFEGLQDAELGGLGGEAEGRPNRDRLFGGGECLRVGPLGEPHRGFRFVVAGPGLDVTGPRESLVTGKELLRLSELASAMWISRTPLNGDSRLVSIPTFSSGISARRASASSQRPSIVSA